MILLEGELYAETDLVNRTLIKPVFPEDVDNYNDNGIFKAVGDALKDVLEAHLKLADKRDNSEIDNYSADENPKSTEEDFYISGCCHF